MAASSPGAIVLVRDGSQTIRLAGGYAQLATKTPMNVDDRFRIGSATKTFVATVALQLVGEGKLSLADSVEHSLPGLVPNGRNITVRELLNHTSGLGEFTSPALEARPLRTRTSASRLLRPAQLHAIQTTARWARPTDTDSASGRPRPSRPRPASGWPAEPYGGTTATSPATPPTPSQARTEHGR